MGVVKRSGHLGSLRDGPCEVEPISLVLYWRTVCNGPPTRSALCPVTLVGDPIMEP